MDRDFFDNTMHDFGVYMLNLNSNCDIPKDEKVRTLYFNEFQRFENKRFAKLVSWLYKNWTYKSFPGLADFNKAFSATSEGQKVYKSPPRETQDETEKSKAFKRVIDGMKMLDKLELEVTRKKMGDKFYNEVSRRVSLSYWVPFIKKALQANLVYQDGAWLMKAEATGEYFNPREFYPPIYYK